jgi:hypothetical protein
MTRALAVARRSREASMLERSIFACLLLVLAACGEPPRPPSALPQPQHISYSQLRADMTEAYTALNAATTPSAPGAAALLSNDQGRVIKQRLDELNRSVEALRDSDAVTTSQIDSLAGKLKVIRAAIPGAG